MIVRPATIAGSVALALGAGIVTYWLVLAQPRTFPAALVPDPAAIAPQKADTPAPAQELRSAALERPLFIAGRKPPPVAAAEPEAAAPPARDTFGDVRLLGVAGAGDQGTAILKTNGKNRRIRLGEQFEGWTLQHLERRMARFSRGEGETRELPLVHARQQDPVAPAATPAATAPLPSAGQPTAQPAGHSPSAADRVASRRARREALLRAHGK